MKVSVGAAADLIGDCVDKSGSGGAVVPGAKVIIRGAVVLHVMMLIQPNISLNLIFYC